MEIVFGSFVCNGDGRGYGHNLKHGGGGGGGGGDDGGSSGSPPRNKDQADTNCSICLEPFATRTTVQLRCRHVFHLDCIGSAFNKKNKMECPNCRNVEQGQWLYASPPMEDFDFDIILPDLNLGSSRNVPRLSDIEWGEYVAGMDPGVTFLDSYWDTPPLGLNLAQVPPGIVAPGRNLAHQVAHGVDAPGRNLAHQVVPGFIAPGRNLAHQVTPGVAAPGRNLVHQVAPRVVAPGRNLPHQVASGVAPPGGNLAHQVAPGVSAAPGRNLTQVAPGVTAPGRNLPHQVAPGVAAAPGRNLPQNAPPVAPDDSFFHRMMNEYDIRVNYGEEGESSNGGRGGSRGGRNNNGGRGGRNRRGGGFSVWQPRGPI